ncbi:MAG: FlgD immunoglobulin-like domain containing protein [Candidatus Cloacimonadaceae bacterium]|nr:FlgD immunoglobulin-like domain containing protein [Candidatus Cloacimonadaceae bacterium]
MKKQALAMVFLLFGCVCVAQNAGDYRSRENTLGNWMDTNVWQVFESGTWQDTMTYPTAANGVITIRTGASFSINSSFGIDQTIVENGALITHSAGTLTLVNGADAHDLVVRGQYYRTAISATISISTGAQIYFEDGSSYIHHATGGNLPPINWHNNATLDLKTTMADNQIYNSDIGNLIVNLGATQSELVRNSGFGFTHTIRGSVTINSGTLSISPAATNITLIINGNLRIVGGTFRIDNRSSLSNLSRIKSARVIGNYIQSGGTLDFSNETSTSLPVNTCYAYLDIYGNFAMSGGTITESALDIDYQTRVRMFGSTKEVGKNQSNRSIQTFSKTGGTISNNVSFSVSSGSITDFDSHVLSGGTGSFTLESGATLITAHPAGISVSGATGSIQTTGSRSFNSSANYVFSGAQAQITGSGLPATVNNLVINNTSGVTLSNPVTVNGTLTMQNGSLGGTRTVDGFNDHAKYLNIAENNILISGLSVGTSVIEENYPNRVKRQWSISGTASGNKVITFYWTMDDDSNFNWGDRVPSIFNGSTEYPGDTIGSAYNVSGALRWITVLAPLTNSKSIWQIGIKGGAGTLPVELSSFTASPSANSGVQIMWITQSETNCMGFYVYRGEDQDFANTLRLNQFVSATNTSQMQSYVLFDREISESSTYHYWLESLDFDGVNTLHGPISITINYDSSGGGQVPLNTSINSIYPNPFNPDLTIDFSILAPANISLKVYNSKGQHIKTLHSGPRDQGFHRLIWDGKDSQNAAVGSGIYYIVMDGTLLRDVKKAVLMK